MAEDERPAPSAERAEISAAIILGVAGLLSAWAAFQAALWGGEQATAYAEAGTLQTEAARKDTEAGQLRAGRLAVVHAWLEAASRNDEVRMLFYERHMPVDQRQTFRDWKARLPADMSRAKPRAEPLELPDIRVPAEQQAKELRKQAESRLRDGQESNRIGDRFTFVTVLLSLVLFLAGISQLMKNIRVRQAVLLISTLLLLASTAYLVTLPTV